MRKIAVVLLGVILWFGAASRPLLAEVAPAAVPVTFWDVSRVVEQVRPSIVGVVVTLSAPEARRPRRGFGTGVVYRQDGYILTNAHVVEGATRVDVVLPGGVAAVVPPEQIWSDALSDVAVIRLEAMDLTPAVLADSDGVKPGQLAIAVGNPLGLRLGNTVSVGVVSGVGRALGTGYPFLQTDAAINPGNSGGALLDAQGRLIGITSAKIVEGGVEGLGFAIPSNTAQMIADRLITEKEIVRSWLGLELEESAAAAAGLPTEEGLKVVRVKLRGPAPGMEVGDEVLALSGVPVHTLDAVEGFLADKRPGFPVTVRYKRNGQILGKQIIIGRRPNTVDPFAGDEFGAGIWRNLDMDQVARAVEFASENRGRAFADWAKDYIRGDQNHTLLLQTEYLHVAARHWMELSANRPLTQGLLLESVGHIQGKMEILFVADATSQPPPYREAYPYSRVLVIQGDRNFPCEDVVNPLQISLFPGGPTRDRMFSSFSCSFASSQVDPRLSLTVLVTDPYAGPVHYDFNLGALR